MAWIDILKSFPTSPLQLLNYARMDILGGGQVISGPGGVRPVLWHRCQFFLIPPVECNCLALLEFSLPVMPTRDPSMIKTATGAVIIAQVVQSCTKHLTMASRRGQSTRHFEQGKHKMAEYRVSDRGKQKRAEWLASDHGKQKVAEHEASEPVK